MARLPQLRPVASPKSRRDWFEDGVRFRCLGTECGACCSGEMGPGAVWLGREEMARLAEHLSLSLGEFEHRYVRRLQGRYSLTEKSNYDCVFYRSGKGCLVYPARPGQCRTYPFWSRVMASRATWAVETDKCPGIGCDDTRVGADEIRRQLAADGRRRARTDRAVSGIPGPDTAG